MNKYLVSAALGCALLSFTVQADVNVLLEDGVDVIAVNGKEVSSKTLTSGMDSVSLKNGLNQMLVQYTAELKVSADETELESTDAFVLLFEAQDKELVLKAPQLNSEKAVRAFNMRADWALLDAQGDRVAVKAAALKKEGFQLTRDYEKELEEYNRSAGVAALPARKYAHAGGLTPKPVPAPEYKVASSQSGNENTSESSEVNMPEQMLQFWYNQADAETRARFLKWVNQ